ncbi:MAG: nucleotidyltransferase family protein [Candidatus Bruticola sp.]
MNNSSLPADFKTPLNVILLAGGTIKDLPTNEPQPKGKGHIMVGDLPMSAHTLRALRSSKKVGKIILVSSVKKDELGPDWEGVDEVVPAGSNLINSLFSGLKAIPTSNDPVLLAAGDLPFLTTEAVDDFLDKCAQKPKNVLWYAFLNKEVSLTKYPEVKHTWVKLAEGTFCGGGLTCIRSDIADAIKSAMSEVTNVRKNPLKIAKILGFKLLLYFLIGRLTIPMIEETASRLLKLPCCGIISSYAETAYNIDDAESLAQARKRMADSV